MHRLVGGQRDQRTLGTARHAAAHMRQRRAARTPGQDELDQPRQMGVVVRQGFVQPQHRIVLEQGVARNGQFATEVKQLVLDDHEQLAYIVGQRLGQQHAQRGIELVHLAQRMDAQVVLGHARAVAQAGGAVIAGAGGDLRKSIGHGAS